MDRSSQGGEPPDVQEGKQMAGQDNSADHGAQHTDQDQKPTAILILCLFMLLHVPLPERRCLVNPPLRHGSLT